MKKKIILVGPVLTQTGYGEHARFMYRALKSREDLFEVFVQAINWGNTGWLWKDDEERRQIDADIGKTVGYMQEGGTFDTSIMVTIPQEWPQYMQQIPAKETVGVTAGVETSRISHSWVRAANVVDKIIFTSDFSKKIFEGSSYMYKDQNGAETLDKVTVPMEVINYPVKYYEAVDLDLDIPTDFNFLVIAQWGIRKNIENTIRWFVEEFYDQEVGLVLKTGKLNGSQFDKEMTINAINSVLKEHAERKCKVYLLHGYINDADLHSLYVHPKINALISLSHGEGFGLPIFEAAYSGLPVITHEWGGQTDFLMMEKKDKKGKTKLRSFYSKVDYDLSPIQDEAVWNDILIKEAEWAYPKQGSYKMKLRELRKNYVSKKSQATKLKNYLKKNFSAEIQYEKVVNVLCDKEYVEMAQWFEELSEEIVEVA
tara:strand:- start:265 stop:1545 length:1281 start_codon:yes stop_codon:yes gene_type:complete